MRAITMNIPYKNTSIHFTVNGQGPVLVLLHGFTESLSIWDGFTKRLSAFSRIVAIDLPGHGQSGCLGQVHTMEEMARCVRTVLDHLEISRCTMVGHSMGGYVSLAFARLYPSFIRGLGLFHSTAVADSREALEVRDKAISVIRQNRKDFLFTFIPSLFAPSNRDRLEPVISMLISKAQQMSSEAIIAAMEGMKFRSDCTDILVQAKFPVLFIAGQQDTRIPIDSILAQSALPETAYTLFLKNAGHMGWAESPEETAGMVGYFASMNMEK